MFRELSDVGSAVRNQFTIDLESAEGLRFIFTYWNRLFKIILIYIIYLQTKNRRFLILFES